MNESLLTRRRLLAGAVGAAFLGALTVDGRPAWAWGPHSEITQAALDALPPDAAIRSVLGDHLRDLHDTCWMADWHKDVREDFFPDDYLLFPKATDYFDHLLPAVRPTYPIFFRRALWALRHETPENAARWVGSLIHFTEDSGSPPHAASIRGPLHTRMENWLDVRGIGVAAGYVPRSFDSRDDDTALAGYLARMEGLIAFSRERAEKLRGPLTDLKTRENQPLILESANEVARVVADLIMTLGERARDSNGENGGGTLTGRVTWPATEYLPHVAARIALLGTDWSTGTDADSRFTFRHLPPGEYRVSVLRPGCPARILPSATVVEGKLRTVDAVLAPADPPGNRLRNPDLSLRWVRPDAPDAWRRENQPVMAEKPPQSVWRSENVRVRPDNRCRIGAELAPGIDTGAAPLLLAVRFSSDYAANQGVSFVTLPLSEKEGTVCEGIVTVPEKATFLNVLLLAADGDPSRTYRRVWCVPASP